MKDADPVFPQKELADSRQRKPIPLKLFFILLIAGWTTAIGASLWYNMSRQEEHALDSARIQARTAVEKDVIYRQWNSLHGGVFVPVVPGKFEPNPYLPVKGREVIGQDGKVYTKINPAYMTRLVHELGALHSGAISHITSLNPIRKGNEPDEWEKEAMEILAGKTVTEVSDLRVNNGKEYMRLIKGLETEPSCLPCHAHQGYQVGDMRGSISVAVPMAPFMTALRHSQRILFSTHLALWIVGILGISFGMRQISGGIKERDTAENELRALTAELEQRVLDRTADLKLRQQQLQALMHNANAGVYLKDPDGAYRIANARFAAILDCPPEDMLGRTDKDLLDPETARRISEHEQRVMASASGEELKNVFISRQGTHYSCFTFPVMEEDRVTGLGCLVVDMTERDKTELVLREAKEAAEKASRAKSDFLANMSHEIRTPLNGVIGMADLLLRTRLTPDQASMAAAIKTSGDSLLLVLNDVLDISKIEAGKLVLDVAPFGLRDVLFDSIKGLTPIAYKKNIELILHVSPSVPDNLLGDSTRIRQVLLNLVNNALKFTDQGEVVVTVLLVSESEQEARMRFSVTDTGIGIPAEKQTSIFNAFEQADSSTTRKYGGTGLGLAICSRLLSLMDAKLELKSHEGFGSSFWFELKLPIEKQAGPGHKPLVCTEALKGVRALIVDDNETNLRILSETLTTWGMEVLQSASADDALALASVAAASKHPVRLILSDLQMPEKDGVDLLRMVRADASIAHLPILLLTSANLPTDLQGENGKPGFFEAVLDKPVRPELLMRSIASALNIWESYDIQEMQREVEQKSDSGTLRLKVLLAEDLEMNQMVATRMLRELGHEVTVVGDGQQALEAVSSEHYDLVFMDIQMPVMDGVQATLAIRELERQGMLTEKLIIVAMTANALKGDKAKYLAVGMDGYLAKPIMLEELRNTISELFTGDGGTEEPEQKTKTSKPESNWCTIHGASQAIPLRVPAVPEDSGTGQPGPAFAGADKAAGQDRPPDAVRSGDVPPIPVADQEDGAIDWELLERSFAGNSEFIIDSMNLYMRDAPRLLAEAMLAVERVDNPGLTVNAHALKGITGYFTRTGAYSFCLELEETGRDNGLPAKRPEVERLISQLRGQMDQLFAEMSMFLQRYAGRS